MALQSPHGGDLRTGRHSRLGRIYLVTTCCNNRSKVFEAAWAARFLTEEIERAYKGHGAKTIAHVIMPDHLHWMFELTRGTLQEIVGSVKGRSAHRINKHRRARGRLWQPGFHDRAIRAEEDLQRIGEYVIHNPVRAGLVSTIEEYPFWYASWLSPDADFGEARRRG